MCVWILCKLVSVGAYVRVRECEKKTNREGERASEREREREREETERER